MKKTLVILLVVFSFLLGACSADKPVTGETTPTSSTTPSVTTTDKNNNKDPDTDDGMLVINVGSYNVKHFDQVSHNFSIIADDIRSKNLEIVGLQEIDSKTTRSNGLDEPKMIAQELGWNYKFSKAIDYQGGGYGHCIVSKYPIKSFVSKALPGPGEKRSFGHAVIDVNGFELNFINTHLTHESKEGRQEQFAVLADYVKNLDNFVIVGDFNTADFKEFEVIKDATLLNNSKLSVPTFPASAPKSAIDNVVVSKNIKLGVPRVLTNTHSDHIMLFTTITVETQKGN